MRTFIPSVVDALGGVLEVQLHTLLQEAGATRHNHCPLCAPACKWLSSRNAACRQAACQSSN